MQNPIQKFRPNSIIFEKTVFCQKNWKFWWAPTTTDFNNFCWNFAHVLVSTHSQKPGLWKTQDLNKIKKKIPHTVRWNRLQNLSKKY